MPTSPEPFPARATPAALPAPGPRTGCSTKHISRQDADISTSALQAALSAPVHQHIHNRLLSCCGLAEQGWGMPALESPPTVSSGVDSSPGCQAFLVQQPASRVFHSTAFLGASTRRQVPLSLLVMLAFQL